MSDSKSWKISKWPFLLGDALLLAIAAILVWKSAHPIAQWEIIACIICVALGAALGVVPFILDYRAIVKVVEAHALGTVSEKIQNLEKLAAQISSATNEWTNAQTQAEKTSNGAKEIADKMAAEVREFSAFMQKMNDSEKSALRLEVEKFRRAESEWLQVLARILDHVFALHSAATRSGQPRLVEQLSQFQNACRDAARRLGLAPFVPAPDELFDAERHQVVDGETKPFDGAVVAETVGTGYTFQGKLLRRALVKLRENNSTGESEEPPENAEEKSGDELSLQSPD
jgi:molecular chaperone GrpE (heat shock protein)